MINSAASSAVPRSNPGGTFILAMVGHNYIPKLAFAICRGELLFRKLLLPRFLARIPNRSLDRALLHRFRCPVIRSHEFAIRSLHGPRVADVPRTRARPQHDLRPPRFAFVRAQAAAYLEWRRAVAVSDGD